MKSCQNPGKLNKVTPNKRMTILLLQDRDVIFSAGRKLVTKSKSNANAVPVYIIIFHRRKKAILYWNNMKMAELAFFG